MLFESQKVADILIIKILEKSVNRSNHMPLKSTFLEFFESEHANYLLLDFSQVEHFDNACISMVITLGLAVVRKLNKKFALCGLKGEIKQALVLARVDELFPIFGTEEEAKKIILSDPESGKFQVVYIGSGVDGLELLKGNSPNNLVWQSLTSVDALNAEIFICKVIAVFIEHDLIDAHTIERIRAKFAHDVLILDLVQPSSAGIENVPGIDRTFVIPFSSEHAHTLMGELGKRELGVSRKRALPERLLQSYLSSIPKKLEELVSLTENLKATGSIESVKSLRDSIHKIAGSAGTFGYVRAGEASRDLAILLEKVLEKGSLDPFTIETVANQINDVKFYFDSTFVSCGQSHVSIAPIMEGSIIVFSRDSSFISVLKQAVDICKFSLFIIEDVTNAVDSIVRGTYRPEIVIFDSSEGDNYGAFSILREIKERLSTNQMQFWMVSKRDGVQESVEAVKNGINLIINKPIPLQTLAELLQQHLSRKRNQYNVFVLDDDKDVCDFCALALREIGVNSEILGDSEHIFETLDATHPDLLLLDINLPKHDGWTLLNILRHNVKYKNLRVVIISGAEHLDAQESLVYEDIWYKPFNKVDFQKKVLDVLEAQRPLSENSQENPSAGFYNVKTRRDFESLMQIMLKIEGIQKSLPFYLAIIKSLDFNDEWQARQKKTFLLECEQSIDLLFSKDYLKGYLGNGLFGVFAGWASKEALTVAIREFITRSEYKIVIQSNPNIYITFSVLLVECRDSSTKAGELIDFAMQRFDTMTVIPSEMREVEFKAVNAS